MTLSNRLWLTVHHRGKLYGFRDIVLLIWIILIMNITQQAFTGLSCSPETTFTAYAIPPHRHVTRADKYAFVQENISDL